MKKTITKFFVAAALLTGLSFGASAQSFKQGDKLLNLGVGLGSTLGTSGLTSTSSIPPISASFEYGFTDQISAGAYVGYSSSSYETSLGFFGTYKYTFSYTIIGARGSYHFDLGNDKFDPYVGAMLGYNVASASVEWPASWTLPKTEPVAAGGVSYSIHAGARYMFAEKFGVFGELGYGIAYLNLGLALKF